MATTTNYSWTTPDDTDLVKDGAAAIRTLGSSADTTVKNLNPGTTAGDIDYYTSSTAKARIAIGTAGQILQVNAGATAPEWAAPAGLPASATATVATTQTTTSTTYADLTTAGPAVTLTTGTKALVIITARTNVAGSAQAFMSYAVSGATTIAASDTTALISTSFSELDRYSCASILTTLSAGSNTFTAKYKAESAGFPCEYSDRDIFVINLGS